MSTKSRIHYFDWLRAIAVLGVIVYHTILPFARTSWPLHNADQSDLLLGVALLFETFGLGVLFLIAGASARFALAHRSSRAFLAERARRLLVPFVVGAIVVVPPMGYIVGRHVGTVSGSYPAFLVMYAIGVIPYLVTTFGLSAELLTNIGMHLWFLVWLFVCSALGLPIFVFLSSSVGGRCVNALARLARWPGATLLLAVPVTLPRIVLYALSPADGGFGWGTEALGWYAIVFAVGYLLYSDDRLVAAVRRDLAPALGVAVLGTCTLFVTGYTRWAEVPLQTDSATYLLRWSLIGITGWAWMLTVLGIGMRAGFMQRRLPAGVGEAALPAYVLHMTIVMAVVFFVVQWPLGAEVKALVTAVLSVGATVLVAAAATKVSFLRPLLGLRRERRSTAPQGTAAQQPALS